MATLERIRNKAGLVVIVIGVGLVAFLLGDLMHSGNSIFRGKSMEVADINGNTISITEYEGYITELESYYKLNSGNSAIDENTTLQIRDQAWNQMVQEKIMTEKYEELGITVTAEEIYDLTVGENIHPQIRQMFTNPETGQFDKDQVIGFLQRKNQDPQANFYWLFLEKQIKNERLATKYRELLKKGAYVTTAQAKSEAEAKKNKVTFDFVLKSYSSISDSTIKISDSDVKSYYSSNKENYKQEASRDIEYVSFKIVPTVEDNNMAKEWITQAKKVFSDPSTDAIQYVNMNSDNDYVDRNFKINQLNSNIRDFVSTAQVNEVYGPYFENETYKLTRLVAIKQVADSVKARHILIAKNNPNGKAIADSLLKLAKSGSDFATLARENSTDNGSAVNGGDLGWFKEGMMVKPFNDACFGGSKGEVVMVESQFGFHIINIQDKGNPVTMYNIATLERKVAFSSKTNQMVYAQAAKYAAINNTYDKFNKSITTDNLTKLFGRNIKANDRNIGSLTSPREVIRWAFNSDTEKGSMSPIFELGDEYVIAFLTKKQDKGYADVNEVKEQISYKLREEKKAELITAEINSKKASSLEALASVIGSSIQNATGIDFSAYQVPGAGVEPALVGAATSAKAGVLSAPIVGLNGVYVVKVINIETTPVDVATEKMQLYQNAAAKVNYKALEVITKKADITDERVKFY